MNATRMILPFLGIGLCAVVPAESESVARPPVPAADCEAIREEVLRRTQILLGQDGREAQETVLELIRSPSAFRQLAGDYVGSYRLALLQVLADAPEMKELQRLKGSHEKLKLEAERAKVLLPPDLAAQVTGEHPPAAGMRNLYGVPLEALTFNGDVASRAEDIQKEQNAIYQKWEEASRLYEARYSPQAMQDLRAELQSKFQALETYRLAHEARKARLRDLFLSGDFEHVLGTFKDAPWARFRDPQFRLAAADLPGMNVTLKGMDALQFPKTVSAPQPPRRFEVLRDGNRYLQLRIADERDQADADAVLLRLERIHIPLKIAEVVQGMGEVFTKPVVENLSDPTQSFGEASGKALLGLGKSLTVDSIEGVYQSARSLVNKAVESLKSEEASDSGGKLQSFLQKSETLLSALKAQIDAFSTELPAESGFGSDTDGRLQYLDSLQGYRSKANGYREDLKPLNDRFDQDFETAMEAFNVTMAGKGMLPGLRTLMPRGKQRATLIRELAEQAKRESQLNSKANQILAEEKTLSRTHPEAVESAKDFKKAKADLEKAVQEQAKADQKLEQSLKDNAPKQDTATADTDVIGRPKDEPKPGGGQAGSRPKDESKPRPGDAESAGSRPGGDTEVVSGPKPPADSIPGGQSLPRAITTQDGKTLTLGGTLGEGGFGKVMAFQNDPTKVVKFYKTPIDPRTGKPITNPDFQPAANMKRELEGTKLAEEAGIQVAKVIESDTIDGVPYVIKERLPQGSFVSDVVNKNGGKLPVEHQRAILDLAEKMVDAELVAGDLSPGNVYFYKEGGKVKAGLVEGDFIKKKANLERIRSNLTREELLDLQIQQMVGTRSATLVEFGGGSVGYFKYGFKEGKRIEINLLTDETVQEFRNRTLQKPRTEAAAQAAQNAAQKLQNVQAGRSKPAGAPSSQKAISEAAPTEETGKLLAKSEEAAEALGLKPGDLSSRSKPGKAASQKGSGESFADAKTPVGSKPAPSSSVLPGFVDDLGVRPASASGVVSSGRPEAGAPSSRGPDVPATGRPEAGAPSSRGPDVSATGRPVVAGQPATTAGVASGTTATTPPGNKTASETPQSQTGSFPVPIRKTGEKAESAVSGQAGAQASTPGTPGGRSAAHASMGNISSLVAQGPQQAGSETGSGVKSLLARDNPLTFMQESLANYRREIDALRRLYEAEKKCGKLPTDQELFFAGFGLPQGQTITVTVRRPVPLDALATDGKKLDPRFRNHLVSVRAEITHSLSSGQHGDALLRSFVFSRAKTVSSGEDGPWLLLPADSLTAGFFGLPESVPIRIEGSWVKLEEREVGFLDAKTGHVEGGRGDFVAGMEATREIRSLFPDVAVEGVPANENQSRLLPPGLGLHRAVITARKVFREIGPDQKAILEATRKFPLANIIGVKAVKIGLKGVDFEPGNPPSLELLLDDRHVQNYGSSSFGLQFEPLVLVTDGEKEVLLTAPASNLKVHRLSGNTFSFGGGVTAQYQGGFGPTRFRLDLGSLDGPRIVSPEYTISAGHVQMTIDPQPVSGSLAAGENYRVRVVVKGAGDLSRHTVEWSPLREAKHASVNSSSTLDQTAPIKVEGAWGGSSTFRKAGSGTWEASTALRILPENLKFWADKDALGAREGTRSHFMELSATIQPGGLQLGTFESFRVIPPRIQEMKLYGRCRSDALQPAPARFDLFTPGGGVPNVLECFLGFTFAGGESVQEVKLADVPWVELKQDGPELLTRSPEGLAPRGGGALHTGSIKLFAVADVGKAFTTSGLLFEGLNTEASYTSEPIAVTVNRLALDATTTPENRRFRLSVFGPADMAAREAQWQLQITAPARTAATLKKRFTRSAGEPFTSGADVGVENGKPTGLLEKVSVLDPDGRAAAILEGPEAEEFEVEVTVQAPAAAAINDSFVLVARISGLPEDLLERASCRWHVDPAIGKFKSEKTLVSPEGPGRAKSTALLMLHGSKENIGKTPEVTAEVVLE
ncbi:MAG: hypothetical protein HYU36_09315 [Planctomycetes bacterium]|nr:hypothetical protein [Planctomycetota bacterium]